MKKIILISILALSQPFFSGAAHSGMITKMILQDPIFPDLNCPDIPLGSPGPTFPNPNCSYDLWPMLADSIIKYLGQNNNR